MAGVRETEGAPLPSGRAFVASAQRTIERLEPRGSAWIHRITLLQRFTLVSLLTTLAVGALFGTVAMRLVEQYALEQHAHSAAVYVSEFLAPRLVATDFLISSPARRVEFEFATRGLIGKAGILRLTVWNTRGQILYSDAPGMIGRTFPLPPPVAAALRGQTRSQILTRPAGREQRVRRAMEVFVPIVPEGARRPAGVYDIVSDLTDLDSALGRVRWSVWANGITGLLVLYVALFTIVRRASRDLEQQEVTLRGAFAGAVRSLVAAVNARDAATATHSDRVADLAVAIAEVAGLGETDVGNVRIAAFLHDVGKIGIADNILDKPGPLTREERAVMQRHALVGYQILLPVPIPEAIKLAVRHHHERWDGSGYPDGLAGEAIPIAARIIAVADMYGALTADRPYRTARDSAEAAAQVERLAGTQFDPRIVAAFQQVWEQWAEDDGDRPASATSGPAAGRE